ncbi:fungal-specific transcription factor domain-containing protein [Daldinia caldariorum]|uniref:fungal-specific transcription factor domain-containing protein n=1 Tax=Daldinia caldariorum TaxID=326644 RepID=UPI0020077B5C|nr:fungal-specific transcription factor domain-containing protein [Daldinia caldariorum]KAI1471801.1 fungal-specific transcription factor domain-containing protein [Daldinia caldariorum]
MDPPRNPQQPDDLAPTGPPSWRPDLPHHFLQVGSGAGPTIPEFGSALPLPGQQQHQHEGLSHLASAAAISGTYDLPSATSPSRTSPLGPQVLNQPGPSAFITNESLTHGVPPDSAQRREQIRAKRRVPNSQRKRTQVSCDACKTRRCKCVRLKVSPESNNNTTAPGEQPPCKLCVETGIPCVTTLPRKQRVYGSVENLDKRYRALEALVFGVFPELNSRATAEELVAFGGERRIPMPDFGESPDLSQASSAEAFVQQPETSQTPKPDPDPSKEAEYPNLIIAGTDHEKTILPPSYLMGFASRAIPQLPPESPNTSADTCEENTGLITDASGRPHYIGSCGSLAFFSKMRDIFAQKFSEGASSDESARPGHDSRSDGGLLKNNPLTASLGGTGDRGRHVPSPPQQYSSGSLNKVLDHLDGDSPPKICEDMLKDHPNDPEFWRYRKRVSQLDLPPKERADACVHAFFHHVHPNFILFHRLTFQTAYEKMWRCWESHRGKNAKGRVREISVSVGWLCCLYMIIILGSRSLPQNADSVDFQRKWFGKVEQLPPLLGTSSLPNVCAYMLLSLYYHNTNDRTSAWTHHGVACRLAIALGMHRESASGIFDPVERQSRKLAWWTLYDFEQFLCCSLGRPSAIDDREMDVGVPNEDYLDANVPPPRYIEHSAQLNMLLAAIRRGIFDPGFAPGRMYARALEFLGVVSDWEDTLPRGLRPVPYEASNGNDNQWRSVLLLNIRYQHVLCFLTRPFLLETIQSADGEIPLGPDAPKIRALSKVCLTGAMRCGNLIVNLWRAGLINGVTWIDIYYAFTSSLDISLALLSPDSLCQDEGREDIVKPHLIQSYTIEEMRNAVRQLCEVMSTIEVCGTNARFAKAAFEFAIALEIIPGESILSLGLPLPESKTRERHKRSNEDSPTINVGKGGQGFVQGQRQGEDDSKVDQGMTGMPGYYPTGDMNMNFQGNLVYPPVDTMGDVRWDM